MGRLKDAIGLMESSGVDLHQRAIEKSALSKIRSLRTAGFSLNTQIRDLVGYVFQKDIENPDSFRNQHTEHFESFLSELDITEEEKVLLNSVIHKLAFPWYKGHPVDINDVTIKDVGDFVESGNLVLIDGFHDSSFASKAISILFGK